MESGQYQRRRKGGNLPDWYLNEPPKLRGDNMYLSGFWELSTERSFGQYLGPIPWSKIILYGVRLGLDDTMVVVFTRMLRELDEAFLEDQRDNHDRKVETTKPAEPGKDE